MPAFSTENSKYYEFVNRQQNKQKAEFVTLQNRDTKQLQQQQPVMMDSI